MNNKIWRSWLCVFVCVFGFTAIAQSPTRLTAKLAYLQEGNIWVQVLTEGIPRQMSQGGQPDHPQWSASGRWLSFDRSETVNVIPIQPIRHDTITLETGRSAWSPKLDEIAFVDHGALAVLRVEPAIQQKRVIFPKPDLGHISDFVWNPDGTSLAVATTSDSRNRITRLWYLSANGTNSREISLVRPSYSHFKLAGWSADREHILLWVGGVSESIAADGLPLISVSGTSGDHQLVTEEMLPYKEYVAMSPVGNSVLVISGGNRDTWTNKRLIVLDTTTGNITHLTDDSTAVAACAWSPDGNVIAFAAGPNDTEAAGGERAKQALAERRIWIMNADGQQRRKLTTDAQYRDEYPLWSQDGQHILFMRMDTQNIISVWSVGVYDETLMKLVDHIMGPAEKDAWFGYYGHLRWPSFIAYYQ
jgi:Tol biopolymer transport system component